MGPAETMNRPHHLNDYRIGLLNLPTDILTKILASFGDGKAISTFLSATLASRRFDALDTVKGVLVERYEDVSMRIKDPDITEILQLLMQQIRDCEGTNISSICEAVKLFSERCAILDYFESHLPFNHNWLIWCGQVECFYGMIQVYITSPYWSIGSIASWYRDLELTQFSLVRPRVPVDRPVHPPFGSILGRGLRDNHIIDRLRDKLDPNLATDEYWKGMMTAIQFAYERDPPLLITTHSCPVLHDAGVAHIPGWDPSDNSLCCYWEEFDGYDDDALLNLGEHVIRLMQRFVTTNSMVFASFRQSWRMAFAVHHQSSVHEYLEESDDESDNTTGAVRTTEIAQQSSESRRMAVAEHHQSSVHQRSSEFDGNVAQSDFGFYFDEPE